MFKHLMQYCAVIFWLFFGTQSYAAADCAKIPEATVSGRYVSVISDLHFGLGKSKEGHWHQEEDFRWSNALKGFLSVISKCGNDSVDLVIAGDMLEMWQLPDGMTCDAAGAGCSEATAIAVANYIISQHKSDLELLGTFTKKGTNRLYILPGNHDAALMLDSVSGPLIKSIGGKSGAVTVVKNGWWSNGQVLIEHGHQIGSDVNRFPNWPNVLKPGTSERVLEQSWGEHFVQRLFNEQEKEYPIIDNLSPESAGVRYRMSDRGMWKSIEDIATFLRFNLFETSFSQKVQSLGKDENGEPVWDIAGARAKKYKLFLDALPVDDPFAVEVKIENSSSAQLKERLSVLAETIPREEVISLCRQAYALGNKDGCFNKNLGAVFEKILHSRQSILANHVNDRINKLNLQNLQIFVYGHTHSYEAEYSVNTGTRDISVFNTGAFQRTVEDKDFQELASSQGLSPIEALKKFSVANLKPCYSTVIIAPSKEVSARTLQWRMDESDINGSFYIPPTIKGASTCWNS